MHSKKGSVSDQSPKPDKINKWEKLINRKIRPEERRNWNFAFVADEIGWFEDYLKERKNASTVHFHFPVDLTEGLDLFQFCLSIGIPRYRDNLSFIDINHTCAFTMHFYLEKPSPAH